MRRGVIAALLLAAWPATAHAAQEVTPAGMRGLGNAKRVLVVSASGLQATRASARTYIRANDAWRRVRKSMPARLGASGLRPAAARHEGDGTTPMGTFGFVYGFGSQRDPGMSAFSWRRLKPTSCWAATRAQYNRWIEQRPCHGEALWPSAGRAYRYAAVVDFNYRRPVYGRGSGIFLHVQTGRPTRGCVSLNERDLLPVLRWLRPGTRIVIGTTAYLRSRKRT